MEKSCLIVGAGVAGLAAGRQLQNHGWRVTLLDKGRVVGGRLATRTFDDGRFDYGAQFFTLRDQGLETIAKPWIAAGLAVAWTDHRYRMPAGIRSIPELMAAGLDVRTAIRATRVVECPGGWTVEMETGDALSASALLLTPPVPQSLDLLGHGAVALPPEDRALLMQAQYWKCLTVLARIEGGTKLPPVGFAEPNDGVLKWVADNFVKGISTVPGCLTLHAAREFSEEHWETPPAETVRLMLAAAGKYFEGRVRSYYYHRWRYAEPAMQMPALFHGIGRLALAGDIFAAPRIGGAVESGLAAAEYLLAA